MTIDPTELADRLPDRPLKPREAEAIAEQIGTSLQTVKHETKQGTPYVATMFLWVPEDPDADDPLGQALGIRMNNEMTRWEGEVLEGKLTHG